MKICPRCHRQYEDKANVCNDDGVRLETLAEDKNTEKFDAMIGTVLEGRYRILSKLGQGGMGAVYKAEQIRMSRMCAIKVIPEEMAQNGDAIERFDREAKMSALINDPHAVTVYDFGETESGMYFLAMEYVEGETLSGLLRREGVLPLNRILPIVRQCGEALTAAHRQNIVHRDLKPDNIMIAKKDGGDWVKVLDFGIAKLSAENNRNDLTRQGMVIGTPLYMSPEQLAGDKLDARSDIYSFALIVYQMLTGALPFQGDNAQALMVKRLTDNPIPPSVINPHVSVPPGVESAIMAALVRERNNRTPSMQHFVDMIDQGSRSAPLNTGPTMMVNTGRQPTQPSTNPQPTYPHDNSGPQGAYQQGNSGPQGAYRQPTNPTPARPMQPTPYPQPMQQNTPYPAQQPTPMQPFPPAGPQQPSGPQPYMPPPHVPTPYPQPPKEVSKKANGAFWVFGTIFVLIIFTGTLIIGYFAVSNSGKSVNDTPVDYGSNNGSDGSTTPPDSGSKTLTASQHYSRGVEFLEGQNFVNAVTEFREALKLQPKYPEAQENLAFALYNQQELSDAIAEAKRAVELYGGKRPSAYNVLGRACYDSKRYLEAAQAFAESYQLDQSNPEIYALAAFSTQLAGNQDLANQMYDQFLQLYTNHPMTDAVRQARNGAWTPPTQLPRGESASQ